MTPIESHEMFVGMLCAWRLRPRGGYGFTVMVPAKIVRLSLDGKRAVISVETRGGATVHRTVSHRSLTPARSGSG